MAHVGHLLPGFGKEVGIVVIMAKPWSRLVANHGRYILTCGKQRLRSFETTNVECMIWIGRASTGLPACLGSYTVGSHQRTMLL